ncbi:hypothetical protein [Pontibacter actiniarum]|uniref:Uncharacterized protein n=1 Tax=Pontibacter actiniarum TaxID=323450 RepID=A0A1X9YRL7_9BACT|nr:hypothetical protein [Pontibacter actiniarum]ARS35491.1 hypothetical protein CA264_08590 [Pontibacter actiniarum]
MLCTRTIRRHWLKYPLMWVMLFWALTMPGHEVMVYDYLVQGSVASSVLRLAPAHVQENEQAVKPQPVQVFDHAESAPVLVVKQVLQAVKLLLLPLFAALARNAEPVYTCPVTAAELLEQVLPASILPNAP